MPSIRSKGQTQQVFLFLAAVLIIIAMIVLGSRLFGGLSSAACEASDADFVAQLRRTLDENTAYGSRNTVSVQAPCDAQTVCFVDATMIASPSSASFSAQDPTMTAIVQSNVKTNIFLRKEQGLMEAGYDERVIVDNAQKYRCISAEQGKFTFRIEGGGRFLTLK